MAKNSMEILNGMKRLFFSYTNGEITQENWVDEVGILEEEAEALDKQNRDRDRRVLELEMKLADAYKDPLMGIFIRRVLQETLLSKKMPTDSTFIMCDIDDFGGINEKYGHPIGDKALKIIGEKVRTVITRSSDLTIRYGGDEVVIVLPNCPTEKAIEKCERIRSLVFESFREKSLDGTVIEEPITLSFGIYHRTDPEVGMEEAIENADAAVYYTKEHKKGIYESGITEYTPDMPKIRKRG
jgi:diguanylate cyclase (GGDEF)-like protein